MTENTTRDIAACLRERVVPPGGSRHGLVIGIEQYRDTRLNLRCAAADAQVIFDLMTDADCGMFPKENVRLLLNEEATRGGIWRAMSALRRSAGAEDTVWIYYAGHAAAEGSNLYWVTHDADVDDLYGTGLGSDQISKVLADIPAKRMLVLLDCCHAAATAAQKNPTRAVLTADEVFSCYKGYGRITLSSSDGKEKSIELDDVGHGAFTYFLEQGLRGEADADGDGVVTADELWRYLRAKVTDASQKAGNSQTPVLLGEMRHDFPLSLNPLEFGRRRKISDAIRAIVGVAADKLTTEEGRECLDLLRRDARNQAERDLMAELPSLQEGRLRITTLRRLIAAARENAIDSPALATGPAHHEQGAEEKTSPKASAKRPDDCKIVCTDDFDRLPGKYHWDREKTLDVINRWSSKYLGVLSNMADRCEVLDIQAHGYFVWQAKMVVEKREWAGHRMGISVPNPSGLLEFLQHKPPRVPKLTPELAERLGEICPECHGMGESLCPECFGRGEVQCPECRGVGMQRDNYNGTYSSKWKCPVCQGAKKLPCTACKGVPKRPCEVCYGSGISVQPQSKGTSFPATRNIAALWSVAGNLLGNAWKDSDDRVIGDDPKAIESCTHCHGTGESLCPECFGRGEVQCPECRGVGMQRDNYNGTYSSKWKCPVCQGAKKLPCTECKGVPKRPCEVCYGSGVVVVYPAIAISRTFTKHAETSGNIIDNLNSKYTIPLVTLEGDTIKAHQAAKKLLERFEGADKLQIAYVPRDKEKARITNFNVDIRWYPYMLCRMQNNSTGKDFVIGINCTCETVFLVSGKCPEGEGLGAWLFGWASTPVDGMRTVKRGELDFMLKQLKQGEGADAGGKRQGANRDDAAGAGKKLPKE